ncbi:MAG: hypothetical protein NTY02_04810 [Acidobacteria bacterium]|nr:hypothetical protein [Acidobacteriota bacterium]
MANRTGIELLPYVCRIVEVQTGSGLFGRGRGGATRVRAFHEIPYSAGSPGFLTGELRQVMKGLERRATVAIWGLRCTHQALLLPPAATADLEIMVRREARAAAGGPGAGPTADGIVIGELQDGGRREVGYVSVQPEEVRARIQPLVDAGFSVQGVVTPAMAHAALVRQRWASFPDAVTAVLSINSRATALTILRGAVVLFAREMPWGHETERAEQVGGIIDASGFAARLASEVRRSLVFMKQSHHVDVSHLLVCGDVPDMRSLTGPLMQELNVEVETLDSLEGLDLSRLPEPADEFRSRLGALRTAWAIASDAAPPINLVSREVRSVSFTPHVQRRFGVAVLAGVLIAGAGWGLVTLLANSTTAESDRLRRQIGVIEPQMQILAEARRNAEIATARAAALRAFASQGPRLARVLEAFSHAAPPDVAITALKVEPGTGSWLVFVEGQAEGTNAATAQVTFNQFLTALKASPLLGTPIKPPSLKVRTEDPAAKAEQVTADAAPRADMLPREVEVPRHAYTGPAYIDVARNGRLFRIPVARPVDNSNLERENELRGRQTYASAGQALMLGAQQAAANEPLKRTPGSVLDFSVQFEVRK